MSASSGFTLPDIQTLPSLALTQKNELPRVPAVYFVLGEHSEVLYIGQSVSLYSRWMSHNKLAELKSLGYVRLAWIELDMEDDLGAVESVLIRHFAPRLNIAHQKRKRNDPDYRGTTFFLRKTTLNRAKKRLVGSGMDISDLLGSLLKQWIAKQTAGKQ